ncbi:MAG: hypothetical protein K5870_04820 [Lachnospiraceae bacterium]|nr:hypothetical protein [Lachnospiraceae bacterium]
MSNNSSKTGLFLMELIMSIMFFSLAAAICVELFVRSHSLSKSSVELNHAVVECDSVAEFIQGVGGNIEQDTFLYTYDGNFNRRYVESQHNRMSASYILVCEKKPDPENPGLITYKISFLSYPESKVIYSIEPEYYVKNDSVCEVYPNE